MACILVGLILMIFTGDQFKNLNYENISFNNLISPDSLDVSTGINQVVLRDIAGEPYYWINNSQLYHARTALLKGNNSK